MPSYLRVCLSLLVGSSLWCASDSTIAAPVDGGPYASLSEAAKQRVRDRYEDLAPGDEPPWPLEGMTALNDALFKIIPVVQAEGTLFAAVEINERGEATSVSFHSLPTSRTGVTVAEMQQLYALPLIKTRYKPALCKGTPCAMALPITQEITLSKVPEKAGPRIEQRR